MLAIRPYAQDLYYGYANGRFEAQAEVKRFLEAQPVFPKDLNKTHVRQQKISNMLKQVMYAGYVSTPKWGVSIRDGKHKGLISKETFKKIQDRLDGKTFAPTRKDIHKDFPLRGAVTCSCCKKPLRSCWSKGLTKSYAYYLCQNKKCERYGKSIAREKIEGDFTKLLEQITPHPKVYRVAIQMFKDTCQLTRAKLEQDRKL